MCNPRILMTIEYLHASKYGNGVAVADHFRSLMAARGVTVNKGPLEDGWQAKVASFADRLPGPA